MLAFNLRITVAFLFSQCMLHPLATARGSAGEFKGMLGFGRVAKSIGILVGSLIATLSRVFA